MTDTRDKRIIEMYDKGMKPLEIARRWAIDIADVYYVILCEIVHRIDIETAQEKKGSKEQ